MPFRRVNKTQFLILAIAAAAASVIVFLGALKCGFVNVDDHKYVTDNPYLSTLALGPAFTRIVLQHWHPLTMLSYSADFRLWGLNPLGYHLTNIILHGLNTFLVAVLTLKLLVAADERGAWPGGALVYASVFSALLFGVHPLRVESVAWVSERKDVLCGFFSLLSVIEYVNYGRRINGWAASYALSAVFFALAILSKPMAVTLPFVLLILDFYPLGRLSAEGAPIKKIALEKVPFFIIAFASSLVTLWGHRNFMMPLNALSPGARAAVAIRGYAFYLYKTVLPFNLAPYYPMPDRPFDAAFAVSALALISLFVLSIAYARRSRAIVAAFLYYVITILPVSGLVQVGGQAAADRYTYLPLLGFTIAASAAAARLFEKSRPAAVSVLAAVTIILSVLTAQQVQVWKDSFTLWTRVIEAYPGKVAPSYVGRGVELSMRGRYDEALRDFDTAVRIEPDFMLAYNDRGVTRMRVGQYAGAVSDFDRALSYDPQNPDIYQNRGISYLHLGEAGRAVSDLEKAVSASPENGVYLYHLGRAYAAAGDAARAKESFEKALGLGVKDAGEELKKLGG